jgi:Fe(3+) dicitrate transport protein
VNEGDELPYVPKHQLTATAGVEMSMWGANLGATYVTRMREKAGQGEPDPALATDAYFLLDAAAHVRPLKFLTIYATGTNLIGTAYLVSRRPFGARPGAPRWLQIGVKLDY